MYLSINRMKIDHKFTKIFYKIPKNWLEIKLDLVKIHFNKIDTILKGI